MSDYMGLTPTLLTTAPEVAEGAHSGLPQFDPAWWPSQILWLALCFAALYFFMSRSALPRLTEIVEGRRRKIESDMKAAEDLSAQAETVKARYEQALKEAATAASEAVKAADAAGKAHLETALADFRKRYDEQVSATEARLAKSALAAMGGMDGIAAEIAAQAAEKIAGIPADRSQAEHVVRSLSQKPKAA